MFKEITIRYQDKEGTEVEIQVPARYEVCRDCNGEGTELYGSMKGYAYSAEEFHDDPDFAEAYIGGNYDVACSTCRGQRVELRPDRDFCTDDQLKAIDARAELERESARQRYADREQFWAESGTPFSERY